MAKITIGDKLIFASHSGVPFNDNKFMIPSTIGFEPQNKTLHRRGLFCGLASLP